jgi:hypothetical protein
LSAQFGVDRGQLYNEAERELPSVKQALDGLGPMSQTHVSSVRYKIPSEILNGGPQGGVFS